MGRKIDMKKIDNVTKCQVTFSKRRSSLMKKAQEIAVCCDVDVAFIAFSPSGRVSKCCNQRRIEDVLHRYVNLPAESRLSYISNVQNKMEKLRHLDHIKSATKKLQFLDKQIENLELQIKKSGLELQILEANLRDYEQDPEQESSLHQLSWCERNINHSLERVIARKSALFGNLSTSCMLPRCQDFNSMDHMELENQDGVPFSSNFNDIELNLTTQNPSTGRNLMQLDPWISQYSVRASESIFQDFDDQTKCTPNMNPGPSNISNLPISSNICNFPIPHSPTILESGNMVTSDAQIPLSLISQQLPLVVDQTFLNFYEQNNVNVWNNFSLVTFSNAIHNSTQSLCTIQPPSQFTNIQGEKIGQLNMDYGNNFSNVNVDDEDSYRVSCNKMRTSDQSEAPHQVHQQNEVFQDTLFDTPQQQDTFEDNIFWTSKIQKSNLWEWEDLLLDENYDLG